MSTAGNNQAVSRPLLSIALLLILLAVGVNVFEGTLRTVVIAVAGLGLVVSAGFAGAAIKRGKQ
ncbi:hypothetical protein OG897_02215 [Streptomyces sp. NBC_00237]|uniref:hypothetical protein n=1 Tax=Streptomyces sp. NBC_00237 TaxID=2975687 RepID=UPI00225013E2|nr:hypothetical protein [Streptomyces sp. NBC_00237]MCX5200279.1 hypothetical protein [Streptomyces sp. NBC_00237]